MKIGFDVDGVLANFVPRYQHLFINTTGRDAFEPEDVIEPPSWNWPTDRGYTTDETNQVWQQIKASPSFWYSLEPTSELGTLEMMLLELEHRHDVYYITSRPGDSAKRQTEAWLHRYLPYETTGIRPTVLICHKKGAAANALALDFYVDDNRDNAIDVAVGSKARSYLLSRRYNQGSLPREVQRVKTLGEVFDLELQHL